MATPRTGRRTTKQRLAISAVFQDESSFMTAQQVFDALRDGDVSVGLATVYRALQTFDEAGEVDSILTESGESLYRACTTPQHHHHLLCRRCGTAIELEAPALEDWALAMAVEDLQSARVEMQNAGLFSVVEKQVYRIDTAETHGMGQGLTAAQRLLVIPQRPYQALARLDPPGFRGIRKYVPMPDGRVMGVN